MNTPRGSGMRDADAPYGCLLCRHPIWVTAAHISLYQRAHALFISMGMIPRIPAFLMECVLETSME